MYSLAAIGKIKMAITRFGLCLYNGELGSEQCANSSIDTAANKHPPQTAGKVFDILLNGYRESSSGECTVVR